MKRGPETRIPIAANDRFGRLTVLIETRRRHYWACRCDCGTVTVVWKYSLTTGRTSSCGCYNRETTRARSITHGKKRTREYEAWARMIQRCRNPKCSDYPAYGGRGIQVCERWYEFAVFFQDMGQRPTLRHSLNRLDNDLGYSPGNVVWATAIEQGRNKRNNRMLTFRDQTKTVAEWVERLGISRAAITHRLDRGWTVERALSTRPRGT